MQTIIGTLLDVTSSQRSYEGRSWIENTAHILDGVSTTQVTLIGPSADGARQGINPDDVRKLNGQRVCLETYSRGHKNGNVYITATRVMNENDIAEALGLVGSK